MAAAISLVYDGTNIGTLGASSAAARTYDELQFILGEGPCLDSVAHRGPVVMTDLADPNEVRWPLYGPALLAHHIRGVTAMPIVVVGEYVGALDLFRTDPGHWDDDQWTAASIAADLATLPLLDLLDDDLRAAASDPDNTPGVNYTCLRGPRSLRPAGCSSPNWTSDLHKPSSDCAHTPTPAASAPPR